MNRTDIHMHRALFFVFLSALVLVFWSTDVRAQSKIYEPLTQENLEKMLFPETADGCMRRIQFFAVSLYGYRDAQSVEELAKMKVIQPFAQDVYEIVRAKGVSAAMLEGMKQFQSCAESAMTAPPAETTATESKPEEGLLDEEQSQEEIDKNINWQEDQNSMFRSCGAINAITLTAIDGVQKKREQSEVEGQAAGIDLDVSGTFLESTENPQKVIVSRIYAAGKGESFDKAVDTGFGFVVQCFGRSRKI